MAYTIEQAVNAIEQLHGGYPYTTRYDHTEPDGRYSIQVADFSGEMSQTYDWFLVDPVTGDYESMFNGHSGNIGGEAEPIQKVTILPINGCTHYGGAYGNAEAFLKRDGQKGMVFIQGTLSIPDNLPDGTAIAEVGTSAGGGGSFIPLAPPVNRLPIIGVTNGGFVRLNLEANGTIVYRSLSGAAKDFIGFNVPYVSEVFNG